MHRPSTAPSHVRLKNRYSYKHKNEFTYDLTVIYMGSSEEDARRQPPSFEVEIEACRVASLFQKPPSGVALSLLYKFFNLVKVHHDHVQCNVTGEK